MVSTIAHHPIDLTSESKDKTPEALARYVTEKLVLQGADALILSKVSQ